MKWIIIDYWCLIAVSCTKHNRSKVGVFSLNLLMKWTYWRATESGALVHYLWNKSIFKQGGSQGIHLTTAPGIYDITFRGTHFAEHILWNTLRRTHFMEHFTERISWNTLQNILQNTLQNTLHGTLHRTHFVGHTSRNTFHRTHFMGHILQNTSKYKFCSTFWGTSFAAQVLRYVL